MWNRWIHFCRKWVSSRFWFSGLGSTPSFHEQVFQPNLTPMKTANLNNEVLRRKLEKTIPKVGFLQFYSPLVHIWVQHWSILWCINGSLIFSMGEKVLELDNVSWFFIKKPGPKVRASQKNLFNWLIACDVHVWAGN